MDDTKRSTNCDRKLVLEQCAVRGLRHDVFSSNGTSHKGFAERDVRSHDISWLWAMGVLHVGRVCLCGLWVPILLTSDSSHRILSQKEALVRVVAGARERPREQTLRGFFPALLC